MAISLLCKKRTTLYAALAILATLFVCIVFQALIGYIAWENALGEDKADRKDLDIVSAYLDADGKQAKDKNIGHLLRKIHDRHVQVEGLVRFEIDVDVPKLLALMNAYSDGSYNGEMTTNPLPTNISFLIPNSKICDEEGNLRYLVCVPSTAGNKKERDLLRSTWARTNLFKHEHSKLVFLFGKPSNQSDLEKLLIENDMYRDVIMGDFIDNYRNLTLKAIMTLKWVSLFCKHVDYVIHAADNAFINIFEMRKLMDDNLNNKHTIICPLWKENTMLIGRDPSKNKKWYVPFNEFPGHTYFPQYCAGLAYIMSQEVVMKLYEASKSTPYFYIDDVYVTGILALKVPEIKYTDLLKRFSVNEDVVFKEYMQPKSGRLLYDIAQIKKTDRFYKMWNVTIHRLPPEELLMLGDYVFNSYPSLRGKLPL